MEILPALIAAVAAVIMIAALHVWYATGLAQVLTAQGAESWRAWIPVLNDTEVFRLGRIDPIKAVLLLVPFVAIYALVLKIVAVHRIGARYGRGAGTTILGIVLPPVWATVLSGAKPTADAAAEGDADDPDEAPAALLAGRPATALPGAATPLELGAALPGAEVAPAELPEVAAALDVAPAPSPGAPVLGVGAVVGGPITEAPVSSAPAAATPAAAAPAAPTPAPAVPAPVAPAPVTPAAAPATPSSAASSSAAPAAHAASVPLSDETPEDRTQMVRQRTRRRGSWDLVLPTGEVVPATARTLVLGRKPSGGDASVQYVTVDDATRTVSKEHARIEWAGHGWAITDLGSTNGVALVAEDGSEQRLAPGVATPLTERFLLGDAKLELRATV